MFHAAESLQEQQKLYPALEHACEWVSTAIHTAKTRQKRQQAKLYNKLCHSDPGKAYRLLRKSNDRAEPNVLTDLDTCMTHTSTSKKLDAAAAFARKLYQKPQEIPQGSDLPGRPKMTIRGLNDQFTSLEIGLICNSLKNNKACGLDGVPPEFIKYGGDPVRESITIMANMALNTGKTPVGMTKSKFAMLFKNKGSPKYLNNYRNLALQSVIGKNRNFGTSKKNNTRQRHINLPTWL